MHISTDLLHDSLKALGHFQAELFEIVFYINKIVSKIVMALHQLRGSVADAQKGKVVILRITWIVYMGQNHRTALLLVNHISRTLFLPIFTLFYIVFT